MVSVVRPGSASSSVWLNPANAIGVDAAFATAPAGSSGWLVLSDLTGVVPPGHQVLGIEAVVTVGPLIETERLAMLGFVFEGDLPDCPLSGDLVVDLDDDTFVGGTTGEPISAILDFGRPVTVGRIRVLWGAVGREILESSVSYSNDGLNWTDVPRQFVPPAPGPVPAFEQLIDFNVGDPSGNLTPIAARYWRASVWDVYDAGLNPDAVTSMYEFTVFGPDLVTLAGADPNGLRRLELGVSKGALPVDVHWAELPAGGGEIIFGGPSTLWQLSWLPGDFANAAVWIRRATLVGEDTLTERDVDDAYLLVYSVPVEGSFSGTAMAITRVCHLGIEKNGSGDSIRGTVVAPTHRVMSCMIDFDPDAQIDRHNIQGSKFPSGFFLKKQMSGGSMDEGHPCYNELGFYLAGICGKPVTDTVSAGVYRHRFTIRSNSVDDVRSFTFEIGEAGTGKRVSYALLNELSLEMDRDDIGMTGSFIARKIDQPIAMTAGPSDVQTLTITATGGTYVLRFRGAPTTALAQNANASAIQTALRALPTVGAGNITVTGTGPFVITGAGTLAGQLLDLIEVEGAALTGGGASIVHTTPGGMTELPYVPILPGQVSLFYASTLAALPTNKLSGVSMSSFKIGDRFTTRWEQDRALTSFAKHRESLPTVEIGVSMESIPTIETPASGYSAATGQTVWSDCEAGARRYVRFDAVGPEITAGNPYSLSVTMFAMVSDAGGYENTDDTIDRDVTFGAVPSPEWGKAIEIILVNSVVGY